MVNNKPFFTETELAQMMETGFTGTTIYSTHPMDREQRYDASIKDTDVFLQHGGPDKQEMRTRFQALHSDMENVAEQYDLDDTVIVMFDDEAKHNSEGLEYLEQNFGVETIVPEESPSTMIEDYNTVKHITSTNDTVRAFTSDYASHKAEKVAKLAVPELDVTVFGAPTEKNSFAKRMTQNLDAYIRQPYLNR